MKDWREFMELDESIREQCSRCPTINRFLIMFGMDVNINIIYLINK
jgi:hypothetical protein